MFPALSSLVEDEWGDVTTGCADLNWTVCDRVRALPPMPATPVSRLHSTASASPTRQPHDHLRASPRPTGE